MRKAISRFLLGQKSDAQKAMLLSSVSSLSYLALTSYRNQSIRILTLTGVMFQIKSSGKIVKDDPKELIRRADILLDYKFNQMFRMIPFVYLNSFRKSLMVNKK